VQPRRAAEKAKPPMLVLLHGIGANENDLVPSPPSSTPIPGREPTRAAHVPAAGLVPDHVARRRRL
jgi:predicted esterase